jgi:putative protease
MIAPAAMNRARRALARAARRRAAGREVTTTLTAASELLAAATPPSAAASCGALRAVPHAGAGCRGGGRGGRRGVPRLPGADGDGGGRAYTSGSRRCTHHARAAAHPEAGGGEDRQVPARPRAGRAARAEPGRAAGRGGRGIARIGDFSLNVTNRLAAAFVLSRDLAAFTPSFDLDASQLTGLLATPFGPFAEVVVHHPMPLFHMEHCVIARAALGRERLPGLRAAVRSARGVAARSGGDGAPRRGGRGLSKHRIPRGRAERRGHRDGREEERCAAVPRGARAGVAPTQRAGSSTPTHRWSPPACSTTAAGSRWASGATRPTRASRPSTTRPA